MTRAKIALTAALAVAIATAAVLRPARAATGSLAISATVNKVCVLTAGSVAFGVYDPVGVNAATPLDAAGTFTVACTKNTAYTIGLDNGQHFALGARHMAAGPEQLPYELYSDSGRTTVWNATNTVGATAANTTPVTLTVYGRVPAAQNVADGSFADTVTSTVTF